jgi:hypothetical protein
LASDLGIFSKGHVYIAVYVDDLLIAGPSKAGIRKIKDALGQRFEMTDLGACTYYLGMSVTRDRRNRVLVLASADISRRYFETSVCGSATQP